MAPVVCMLALCLLVAAAPAAQAQPDSGRSADERSALADEAPGPVDQKQALERVRARYEGEVISISEVSTEGEGVRFRVRLDNDGNIFTVYVDRATGRVSRDNGND